MNSFGNLKAALYLILYLSLVTGEIEFTAPNDFVPFSAGVVNETITFGNDTGVLFVRHLTHNVSHENVTVASNTNDTSLNLTESETEYYSVCNPLRAQQFMVDFLKSDEYNAAEQPSAPLVVNASLTVREIMDMNEMTRQAKISGTFFQYWWDSRLKLDISGCYENISIPLPETLYNSIWVPGTRISNAISSTIVNSPARVESLTVEPTGRVSMRVNMMFSLPCAADYTTFPFDDIECYMVIGTWLSKDYMRILWLNGGRPVSMITSNIKLASFAVGEYDFHDTYNELLGGRTSVRIRLHRFPTYFYLTIYVPSSLVVFLAWSSFWFEPDGGRVGLCLTSLVTLNIMFAGVSGSLPKVGYMKGVDLWMCACIIFVCIPMIEYSFIAYLTRAAGDDGLEAPVPIHCFSKMTVRELANWLDRIFRPLMFIIVLGMAITYFSIYYRSIDKLVARADEFSF